MIDLEKTCSKCNTTKTLNNFYKCSKSKLGVRSICIKCDRERGDQWYKDKSTPDYRKNNQLKVIYGIDINDYNKIFNDQKGCCGICKTHQSELKRALAVDHCHETNVIRMLLCDKCNMGLGLFNHNVELLNEAIKYLNKPSKKK